MESEEDQNEASSRGRAEREPGRELLQDRAFCPAYSQKIDGDEKSEKKINPENDGILVDLTVDSGSCCPED